jgi:tetratricopeptide (TPR) repeat protein
VTTKRHPPNLLLRQARVELMMTRQQFADALTPLVCDLDPRHPGVSVFMVKTWETGRARPRVTDATHHALCVLTGRTPAQLGLDTRAPNVTTMLAPPDLEAQLAMSARRALSFLATTEATVGPETLAQLHDEVRYLASAYPGVPLTAIMGDLVETQDVVFRLLEGHPRPADTRDLYLLAGITSGMLAKAAHDAADTRSAMTQARAAYVCADNAGHNGMRAWVRGLQSLISYWAGRHLEAARFAQQGHIAAGDIAGTARIWLACLDARASAALGDKDATAAALARAREARDRADGDDLDQYGGIMTFPRPRQLYYTAEAATLLGDDLRQAQAASQEAVSAYQEAAPEEWAFGDQAGAHTNLAITLISQQDLDGAAEAVRPVLDLPPEQRCHGIVVSANRVHSALRTHGDAKAARRVIEEIEAFARTRVAAIGR